MKGGGNRGVVGSREGEKGREGRDGGSRFASGLLGSSFPTYRITSIIPL